MDASEKGKSEGASERVEDGRASTKAFNEERNRKQEKKWTKPRKMGRSNPRDTTDLFRQCLAEL